LDYSRVISSLSGPLSEAKPVILPDFFVDHFVKFESFEEFLEDLRLLADQGGGNLLGSEQFITRGGNSVNTASALLRLGLDPVVIVTTDSQGESMLQALASPKLDLSHVHTDGRLSSTVSIETEYRGRRINLMVSDSGSAGRFGFSNLDDHDLESIRRSGLVALLNLNHNESGAALAADLFEFVRAESKAQTFMDIGDPSGHPEFVRPLIDRALGNGLVDVLGVNENEVHWLIRVLEDGNRWSGMESQPEMWLDAARFVSSELHIRLDLHTPYYAATILDDHVVSVPAFEIQGNIALGAGDAWNAGDIWGLLHSMDPQDRLILANAVASLYVSSKNAEHPSRYEVKSYLESGPFLSGHGKKLLKLG
jgi:sugar/nucleoside kinase (ribokinase family)